MSGPLRVEQLLRRAVAHRVAPAIAFSVSRGDESPSSWYFGRHRPDGGRVAGPDTVFDLASLTKPLTTTLWCLRLIERGAFDLSTPIGTLTDVADAALASAPLHHLLNHTSGLPAHRAYYRGLGPSALRSGNHRLARAALRRMLRATELEAPPGRVERYSDLGFLLLEAICEEADGPFASVWHTLPGHSPGALHFVPLPRDDVELEKYASTEACPWRGRLIVGEVHDDNAWTMGGVAGHAGTFGSLDQVHGLAHRFMRLVLGRQNAGLGISAALASEAVNRRWMHPQGTRVLGWDTPTPGASTSGTRFGRRSIGHLGFTGTSVWIDLDAEVVMVLLTNRVSPNRANDGIRALRPALHDEAWTLMDGA